MPNWCSNEVIFHGNPKKINVMYEIMKISLGSFKDLVNQEYDRRNDKRPDDSWIGYMAFLFGAAVGGKIFRNGEIQDESKDQIISRGFLVTDPELSEDGEEIRISVESAWSPLSDLWYFLANRCGVDVDFTAEEPGCEIYINTDTSGNYFTDRYHIYSEEYGDTYYESEEEFLKDFNKETGKNAESFTEAEELAIDFENLSIHEFTLE